MMQTSLLALFLALISLTLACDLNTTLPMQCLAEKGYNPIPDYRYRLWDMASLNNEDYEKLWAQGYTPSTDDLRGMAFDGLTLRVGFACIGKAIYEIVTGCPEQLLANEYFSQGLTFQKRFFMHDTPQGESGTNYWSMMHKEHYPMKIYVNEELEGHGTSLKIDYAVKANPELMRGMIDEIRRLEIPVEGGPLYIGKMHFRPPLHMPRVFFLWFALQERGKWC
eukprot:gnl/Trimastix_PCT/413.p1 GENE.gnl/Trimastix_PCT/413~~gnl/Trimastix_PCT/413.p1  ORF type:complete len:236 (+),score=43.67 gnl/Trimastix_PCT/413:42-710(+)